MPVTISVPVQIPPKYVLHVEALQSQLAEYAQLLIDNAANGSRKIYSAADMASHTCSPEELRDDLLNHVKSHFHPEV